MSPGQPLGIAAARKRVDQLTLAVTQADVDAAVGTLRSLLLANQVVRSPKRDENGKLTYEEVPDNPVRLAAAVKIIEHGTGKPRQSVDLTTDAPGKGQKADLASLVGLMAAHPDVVTRLVDAAQELSANRKALPLQVVASEKTVPPPESESEGATR